MRTLFCFILFSASFSLSAQTRNKDITRFTNALNELALSSLPANYDPFTYDSAFHAVGDTLTCTIRYTEGFFIGRVRYAVALKDIESVGHDLNLVLYVKENAIQTYDQKDGASGWTHVGHDYLILIGSVDDQNKKQMGMKRKIEKAWRKVRVEEEGRGRG